MCFFAQITAEDIIDKRGYIAIKIYVEKINKYLSGGVVEHETGGQKH
jgi:hypothetical protein